MSLVEQQEKPAPTTGLQAELKALVSGCAVYRPDRSLFSLTGRDRVRWLNGMVSNNIRDLAPGHGVYAFVLNVQGHIQGDLYAFKRGESVLLEVERAQVEKLLPLLRRYIIMDKVEIEDLSDKTAVIQLIGPQSDAVLASLGLSSNDLNPLQIADRSWNGSDVIAIRSDNPCVPDYKLCVAAEVAPAMLDALAKAGAVPVHSDALESFRILCGIPKIGSEIIDRTLPQETGQERALNFTKGCYIGQEIVERIRARGAVHRTLTGFELEGAPPAAGTKIQSAGKDVGEITSLAIIPSAGLEKAIGLGYLRKEFLSAQDLTADSARVAVAAIPFTTLLQSFQ